MVDTKADDLTAHLIELEREGLERWAKGDPSGFLQLCAPEVTYFDPFIGERIDGLEQLRAYYGSLAGKISVHGFELLNPEVWVRGEVAVLTFNYVSFSRAGLAGPDGRWNCTEVYARTDEQWKIVQTHWSRTQPRDAKGGD